MMSSTIPPPNNSTVTATARSLTPQTSHHNNNKNNSSYYMDDNNNNIQNSSNIGQYVPMVMSEDLKTTTTTKTTKMTMMPSSATFLASREEEEESLMSPLTEANATNGDDMMVSHDLMTSMSGTESDLTSITTTTTTTATTIIPELIPSSSSSIISPPTSAITSTIPPKMSTLKLILFAFFPIAMTSSFTFSLAVLLPIQLVHIVGNDSKAFTLGVIGAVRALCTASTGLIAGYASDHLVTRFGKRMPLILIGSIVNALFLLLRVFLDQSGMFMLICNASVLILGDMAGQVAMTCYMSLFPDLFHSDQMGLLSGLNSFVQLLASAIGVSLLGFIYDSIVPPIAVLSIVGVWMVFNAVVLVAVFREPAWHYHPSISWIDPHKQREHCNATMNGMIVAGDGDGDDIDADMANTVADDQDIVGKYYHHTRSIRTEVKAQLKKFFITMRDMILDVLSCFKSWNFIWLFVTRCMFTLCLGIVQTIGLYFFQDKVGPVYWFFATDTLIKDAQQAQAVFMLCVLVTGLFSSIAGGVISDKAGRRPVIMTSSLVCAVGMICLGIFTSQYTVILFCAVLMGLGVGAFMASDLGLANDVIDPESSAKELATFQVSQTLPLIMSGPICAFIIEFSNRVFSDQVFGVKDIGYNILIFFCAGLSIATALGIWCIRSESPRNRPRYDQQQQQQSHAVISQMETEEIMDEEEDNNITEDTQKQMMVPPSITTKTINNTSSAVSVAQTIAEESVII